jgi:hypothetical protein
MIYSIVFIALLLISAIVYLKLLQPIKITQETSSEYWIAGIMHIGSYNKIGESLRKARLKAESNNIAPQLIAVYLDNPQVVKEENCRTLAGIRVTQAQQSQLIEQGMIPYYIGQENSLICRWKGRLILTRIFGAIRCYPKLSQQVKSMNLEQKIHIAYDVYLENETQFVMQWSNH